MKKVISIMMFLLLTIGLAGCSKEGEPEKVLIDKTEGVSPTTGDSNDNAIISVNFQLQDESGAEKYNFNEGKNIIFRLDIINNGEEDIIIHNDIGYIIGNDVFHVYSSKGEDFGTPYDVLIIPEVGLTIIPSKSRVSFLCPWVNDSNSGISRNPRYLDYEIDKSRPLPKGDYYSQFTIRVDDNRFVTCKRAFKIE